MLVLVATRKDRSGGRWIGPSPWVLGAAATLFSAGLALAQTQFVEQQSTRLPQPPPSEYTNGADLADVDGDDDLDIIFSNGSGFSSAGAMLPQRLYINDGTGHFTDESVARINQNAYCRDIDLGDLDGDGDLDLVMAIAFGQQPRILMNNVANLPSQAGVYTNQTASRFPVFTLSSEEVSFADTNDDGDLDIYFCNGNIGASAQDRLLINDGLGVFANAPSGTIPVQNLINAQDADFVDLDGDLDLDILISHRATGLAGQVRVYINQGTTTNGISSANMGVYADLTAAAGNNTAASDTYSIAEGDINNDVNFSMDLFGVNSGAGGADTLWTNNGMGMFTPVALPANSSDDNDAQFFDADSDGDMDFAVASLGPNERLYRNNGSGTFTIVAGAFTAIADSSLDLAVGDIDGDDKVDVITGQGESGSFLNRIYMNIGGPFSIADNDPPTIPYFENITGLVNPADFLSGYRIRANVRDSVTGDNGGWFSSVTLNWTITAGGMGSGAEPMKWVGGDIYRGMIPVQSAGVTVEYSIAAVDKYGNAGASSTKTFTVMGTDTTPPTLVSSNPADGSVDVRQDQGTGGVLQGATTVTLTFSEPIVDTVTHATVTPASFPLSVTSNLVGLPPITVASVAAGGLNEYILTLDRPLIPGAWTTITADVEDTAGNDITGPNSVDLGFLPADVSGDKTVSTSDALAQQIAVNACAVAGTCSDPAVLAVNDTNRNGAVTAQDLLRIVQLLNGVNTQNVWNGVSLPAQP